MDCSVGRDGPPWAGVLQEKSTSAGTSPLDVYKGGRAHLSAYRGVVKDLFGMPPRIPWQVAGRFLKQNASCKCRELKRSARKPYSCCWLYLDDGSELVFDTVELQANCSKKCFHLFPIFSLYVPCNVPLPSASLAASKLCLAASRFCWAPGLWRMESTRPVVASYSASKASGASRKLW